MNKEKKSRYVYGIIGILLVVLCFLLNYLYRPYVYSNHLDDLHIADSYSSFLGVPIIVFFSQVLPTGKYRGSIYSNILFAIIVLVGIELVDGLLAKQIDWIDINASIISGCLLYVLYWMRSKKNRS